MIIHHSYTKGTIGKSQDDDEDIDPDDEDEDEDEDKDKGENEDDTNNGDKGGRHDIIFTPVE